MRKFLAAAVFSAATMACVTAHAQSSSVPNGPYGDNDSVASLRSHEQLIAALKRSAHASGGAITYGVLPWKSNGGREVPYVVVGTGPTAALIVAQQHGDEMETSDSAVNLARTLGNGSMSSKAIRNALTVVIVPRVNVDGFDGQRADGTPLTDSLGRTPPWRQNFDPTFSGPGRVPAFYLRGRGYDINRYHPFRPGCPLDNPNHPDIGAGVVSCETQELDSTKPYTLADLGRGNPVPEAKNVRWLADKYRPAVTLDLHHQGTPVNDGRMVTASTLWPTALATAQRLVDSGTDPHALARFNAGQQMAKRAVVVIAQTLAQYPYANLSRYPGGAEPGISRNAYGLLGSGSVLLELRGGIGTKSGGYIQKIGFHAAHAVLHELARDAGLNGFDPNQAEVLVKPANGVHPGQGESEPIVEGTVLLGDEAHGDDHHDGN